jgi:hypothetical protein
MKRFVAILVFILVFVSCDTPDTPSYQYYHESFRISKINFDSVSPPSETTRDSNSNYKNQLKVRVVAGSVQSGTDNQTTTYQFLNSLSMSVAKMNESVSLANSKGNSVIWFEYNLDSNYYVIVYVERL